jgi:hypothetical protein
MRALHLATVTKLDTLKAKASVSRQERGVVWPALLHYIIGIYIIERSRPRPFLQVAQLEKSDK